MQDLLNEIDTRISALRSLLGTYTMPNIPEDKIIEHFLAYREAQRDIKQHIEDLSELRDMIQGELDAVQVQAQQKALIEETRDKQKSWTAETKKILKQLSKLDPCSPESARALLNLSNIGR